MANAYLLRRGGYSLRSYFTDFPATQDPLFEFGAWRTPVNFYLAPETTPGRCFSNGPTDNFDDALAQLVQPQLIGNTRITTTMFRQGGYTPTGDVSHESGHYHRIFIDNSNPSNTLVSGYEFLFPFNSSAFQIVAWLGVNHSFPDNFNVLSPTALNGGLQPIQDNDVLVTEIEGSTLRAYQNGVQIATLVDTTFAVDPTRGPGMGFFPRTGATPSAFCFRNWKAELI